MGSLLVQGPVYISLSSLNGQRATLEYIHIYIYQVSNLIGVILLALNIIVTSSVMEPNGIHYHHHCLCCHQIHDMTSANTVAFVITV